MFIETGAAIEYITLCIDQQHNAQSQERDVHVVEVCRSQ